MKKLKTTKTTTSWLNLPEEIQFDILLRAPVKSICRLRCVCKSLLQVIDSPNFTSIHSRSLILTNNTFALESPLITLYVRSGRNKDYSSKLSEILSISSIGISYNPCFSFQNLICFRRKFESSKGVSCFLLDPFREEVLVLPNRTVFCGEYGMGFDKINNAYKIVCTSSINKRSSIVALVHVLGTSSWREIPIKPSLPPFGYVVGRICAYGDVHWIYHDDFKGKYVYSFDCTKEEFFFIPHPPTVSSVRDYYITLKGRMAVVSVNHNPGSIDVWVMKDYSTKEWTLEYRVTTPMNLIPESLFRSLSNNCGEWDHGIVFVSEYNILYFLDLSKTGPEVECIIRNISSQKHGYRDHCIFSLRSTLISVKQFGKSVQDPKSVGSTYYTLQDFSKKYLRNEETSPRVNENKLFKIL